MSVKNNLKTNFNRHCERNITTEESTLLLSSLCLTRRSIELNSNGCPIRSGMTVWGNAHQVGDDNTPLCHSRT